MHVHWDSALGDVHAYVLLYLCSYCSGLGFFFVFCWVCGAVCLASVPLSESHCSLAPEPFCVPSVRVHA